MGGHWHLARDAGGVSGGHADGGLARDGVGDAGDFMASHKKFRGF
jgi:hypothetical protein